MGLLRRWLGPREWERFEAERGSAPFSVKGVAAEVLEAFDWDHLGQSLAARAADVLVLRRGEDLALARPRSLAALRKLFDRDASIALRNAQHVSERVRAICAELAEDVPGNQRALVFATPANTHSLGWHFDTEELFIVQLAGSKTHYLRANTVVPRPLTPSGHNLAAYALETSPMRSVHLQPGDFLYVPSGWWHMARARHTSLSLSIAVLGDPLAATAPVQSRRRAALDDRIRNVRARLARVRAAAAGAAAASPVHLKQTLRRWARAQ